jgi:hypothetical protein
MLSLSSVTVADPWLSPGNSSLRHDIELLADAEVIRSPVTTWPMSWPDIARDVLQSERNGTFDAHIEAALRRVQQAARRAEQMGFADMAVEASAAEKPTTLRTFEDTPRGSASLSVDTHWLSGRWALRLKATAIDPSSHDRSSDKQSVRLDGSFLGLTLGNFMISAGSVDKWWGPGWEGSLILSSNARPIPSIAIERNYSDAPSWPLLRWIGPWRASVSLGRLDQDDVPVPDVSLFAARVNFRPRPWFELGLSRTAQWCGKGRPCDFSTFGDLLTGRDNRSDALPVSREPGNQMGGYDFRVRSPWKAAPVAFYGQLIGEDEAGGLPSRLLGLLGTETWGGTRWGSYRLHAEYANTSCNFSRQPPLPGCAYPNLLYPQGYTFEGRIIGHTLGRDGRMYSLGSLLVREGGDSFSFLVRRVELNKGGLSVESADPATATQSALMNLELQYNRTFAFGELGIGLGLDDFSEPSRTRSDVRSFVQWRTSK